MPATTVYSCRGTKAPGLRMPGIGKKPLHSTSPNSSVATSHAKAPKPRPKRGKGFQPGPMLKSFMLPLLDKFARLLKGDWSSSAHGDGDALLGKLWQLWRSEFMETVYVSSRDKMEKWLANEKDFQSPHRFIQMVSSLMTVLPQVETDDDHIALLAWCGHLHQLRRQASKTRAREARKTRLAEGIRWHLHTVAYDLESYHPCDEDAHSSDNDLS